MKTLSLVFPYGCDSTTCFLSNANFTIAVHRRRRFTRVFIALPDCSLCLYLKMRARAGTRSSQVLPTMCKWTSLRYRLFAQTLAERSTVYWYDDALAAPLPWHYNLIYYLGLVMPAALMEWSVHVAVSEPAGLGFFDTGEAKGERPDLNLTVAVATLPLSPTLP